MTTFQTKLRGAAAVLAMAIGVGVAWSSAAAEPAKANADWPQWRGPTRDGVVPPGGPKLLDTWPKEGPKLLWKSEHIPSIEGEGGKRADSGGCGSPVVADGKVFVFVHWRENTGAKIVVTTQWLKELGWEVDVPEELAKKIETARLAKDRKDLSGAALEKYIAEFIAGLDPKPEAKLLDHVKRRLEQGSNACNWRQLTEISKVRDKEFASITELDKALHSALSAGWHGGMGNKDSAQLVGQPLSEQSFRFHDVIVCLDANSGKELWRAKFPGANLWGGLNWGASGTPAVVEGKCYVAGSAGTYCVSTKDGSVVWKAKSTLTHSSPLVANGRVFYVDGGMHEYTYYHEAIKASSALVALDAKTGSEIWRQPKVACTAASPALWTNDGKDYLLCISPLGFSCVDPETGAVLWQDKGHRSSAFTGHATPVVRGDIAYLEGWIAYKLTPQKAEVLWKSTAGGKTPGSGYGFSTIVHQDYGYYGGSYQQQQCFNLKTGERVWNGSEVGNNPNATFNQKMAYMCFGPVLAGDRIITYLPGKSVAMLQATPEKCKELGLFEPKPNNSSALNFQSTPAVAGGKLYLRLGECVACYDLTEAGNQ